MKLFRVLSVPANKFSVFLRYTGRKIGLRTRGYVVRGNMFRIKVHNCFVFRKLRCASIHFGMERSKCFERRIEVLCSIRNHLPDCISHWQCADYFSCIPCDLP